MKILVLGASGLLGGRIKKAFLEKGNTVLSPTHGELDVTSINDLRNYISDFKPNAVINCVALADVDLCETNIELAYKLNVSISENLARLQENADFKIVHISTDHFYDGKTEDFLSKESDQVFKNTYALTKYCGELPLVNKQNTLILRTNFFGRSISKKKSFTDWLFDCQSSDKKIDLFTDIFFTPVHITTIIEAIEKALSQNIFGVYNLGSREGMSKADFARYFLSKINPNYTNYSSVSSSQSSLRAERPKQMKMDPSLFEVAFQLRMPTLKSEIDKAIGEYSNES